MTGEEFRRIMKLRRIKTVEMAHALGIHPQTIRNLWAKDEVPKLYLMAMTTYVWAIGMDPIVVRAPVGEELAWARRVAATIAPPPKDPRPKGLTRTAKKILDKADVSTEGGDLWSRLK